MILEVFERVYLTLLVESFDLDGSGDFDFDTSSYFFKIFLTNLNNPFKPEFKEITAEELRELYKTIKGKDNRIAVWNYLRDIDFQSLSYIDQDLVQYFGWKGFRKTIPKVPGLKTWYIENRACIRRAERSDVGLTFWDIFYSDYLRGSRKFTKPLYQELKSYLPKGYN